MPNPQENQRETISTPNQSATQAVVTRLALVLSLAVGCSTKDTSQSESNSEANNPEFLYRGEQKFEDQFADPKVSVKLLPKGEQRRVSPERSNQAETPEVNKREHRPEPQNCDMYNDVPPPSGWWHPKIGGTGDEWIEDEVHFVSQHEMDCLHKRAQDVLRQVKEADEKEMASDD